MAEGQHDDPRAENQRLRSCISDLLGVFTLPSLWYRCIPERVLAILLDVLMRLLDLEFVYARLHLSERPVDVYRLAPGRRYSRLYDDNYSGRLTTTTLAGSP